MFLPVAQYHEIIDISERNQCAALEVVVEATSRKEVLDYLKAHGLDQCDVFKEQGEEIYRGLCPVTVVKSTK